MVTLHFTGWQPVTFQFFSAESATPVKVLVMLTSALLVGLGVLVGLVLGSICDRFDVLYSCHRCNERERQYKCNAIVRNADLLANLGDRMKESRQLMCPHCARRMEWTQTEYKADGSVDVKYEHDCSA